MRNITVDVAVLGLSQLPQEEAFICHLATTRPPLRRSPLAAHQLQQSANQSLRPLTHSMIIWALEESVPLVLGYSGHGKAGQGTVYLHFYKTQLQVIVVLSSSIMLSTKETIKVPNVIRMIIPERIVIKYMTLPRVWVHATKPRYPSEDFEQVRCVCSDIGSRPRLC